VTESNTETTEEKVPADRERWNRKFAEHPDEWFFGREPSEMARLTLQYWRQIHGEERGNALDLGCGEGRDAVYFARHGFSVTAVDGSEIALGKARRLADEASVSFAHVLHCDAREVPLDARYDIVHAHNSLQFLGAECVDLLHRLQQTSPSGGLHAISAFTNETESLAGRGDLYRFDRNELKFHYRGWRLLFYGEEILWREPANMYLSFARIIAQKP
jgi:tellurite methyltransferase